MRAGRCGWWSAAAWVAVVWWVPGCSGGGGGPGEVTEAETDGEADGDGGLPPVLAPALRDGEGRAVFYLGVNIGEASKWSPDLLPGASDAEYDLLRSWGVSAVRFLVFWEGVEPERGVYDSDYLAAVRVELDRLAARGIEVVVDLHQDVFGRGFGYAGAPRWACDEALYASFRPQEPWFMNYLEEEVETCFEQFWTDPALWDAYREVWRRIVAALGDHPAVVGYDLMNEPAPGTSGGTAFERTQLAPFYAHLAEGLAGRDPADPLWIEPAITYDFVISTRLPPFTAGELFAPHYYPTWANSGDYDGDPTEIRGDLDEIVADALALGGPLVVGEFGTPNDVPAGLPYLSAVIDESLARGASALVWDFSRGAPGAFALLDPDGAPYPFHDALVRPYAHRVAGNLLSTHYDRDTGVLTLAWEETGLAAPTVVVAPPAAYPAPVVDSDDPPGSWSWEHDPVSGRITLTTSRDVPVHRVRVGRPER